VQVSVQELSSTDAEARDRPLEWALERIADRAQGLDLEPRFPEENFIDLGAAGVLPPPVTGDLVGEARLVRAVAGADASTARILDGHLNGLERLSLCASEPLRSQELAQIQDRRLLLGVWGADPAPGEGPRAHLESTSHGLVLRGVKTFCSGAGGVQRALVIATDEGGARVLVYLDTDQGVSIDRGWYQASGLRCSESHRVEFHDTPVLALLGEPGELSREPYFSRDAIRTSATWAGLADSILTETLKALDPARVDDVQAHTLGRMRVAQGTIDRWLEHTTITLDRPEDPSAGVGPAALAVQCRVALTDSARLISTLAAQVCGSRALVDGSALDRARRDLDLFLLQHRLDPSIIKLGLGILGQGSR
jgi:alkylation response protein AidB-like acyl-CoA dehydrogenase